MILLILEYGDVLLTSVNATVKKRLQTLQNKALKGALGLDHFADTTKVHCKVKSDKLCMRRKQHIIQLKYKQRENPFLWKRKASRRRGARTRYNNKKLFVLKTVKTERLVKSITVQAPSLWNSLPQDLQEIPGQSLFKSSLRKFLTNKNQNKKKKDKEKA